MNRTSEASCLHCGTVVDEHDDIHRQVPTAEELVEWRAHKDRLLAERMVKDGLWRR
jgi:hypothetical protein